MANASDELRESLMRAVSENVRDSLKKMSLAFISAPLSQVTATYDLQTDSVCLTLIRDNQVIDSQSYN